MFTLNILLGLTDQYKNKQNIQTKKEKVKRKWSLLLYVGYFYFEQQTLGTSFVSNANPLDDDDVEEEVQELGHAETYANYMPTKCK